MNKFKVEEKDASGKSEGNRLLQKFYGEVWEENE